MAQSRNSTRRRPTIRRIAAREMEAHHIRRSQPIDRPSLLALWERSVRATHGFLTDEDIAFYRPLVAEILAGDSLEVWVLADASKVPIGFLGLSAHSIEALFLEPAHQRRGWGRRLVAHAQQLVGGALTVDVNEENHAARSFYEAIGFAVVGASPLDGTGRPHPLLHLRREPPHDALPMLPSVRRVTAAHRTNDA